MLTQTNQRGLSALKMAAVAAAVIAPMGAAHATNGYFPHGYGIKAKGMGGASLAMAQDTFAGANNPAQAAFAGNRVEVGLEFFSPKREMSRSFGGMTLGTVKSDKELFYVPEMGFNTSLSDELAVGVTVYGNGGMNTSYPGGTTDCTAFGGMAGSNAMCGMGGLGVDLMQLIVAPTVAYKFTPEHSVGVSPLFVYQMFSASGLQMFQMTPGASTDPQNLTNNGHDSSTGLGVRLGYMGKLTDELSVGASYSPKVSMSRFKDYAGLFADRGKFDIPENMGVGLAFQATPNLQLALDYNRINYSKIPAIGNPAGFNMGAQNGGGFGWKDVNVFKLGAQWQMNEGTTLRVGYNRGDNPVTGNNITPNILAPGVMKEHYTLGGTHKINQSSELSWHFMYAPSVTVKGPSMFNGLMGSGTAIQESVKMRQMSLGIQWGMTF
ncbi:outer membrane protein transport protein [Hydrogenophaga sp. 5NK40-0174]|uniref:OmpP1/FadL family transporter n=1 Tax=Hydrogenophaga sp. 5NK40-0174 TaxID=3127649 RepID=UPI003106F44C